MPGTVAIIGAGPGIGTSVARRFAREGHPVALVARREGALDEYLRSLLSEGAVALGVAADAGDPAALEAAWCTIVADLGDPEVLVYNAFAVSPRGAPTTLDPVEFEAAERVNITGALVAAQLAAPAMRVAGHGTVIMTGGGLALEPSARATALSVGKAGLRSLTFMLAEELGPHGIHVATVTVCGPVAPSTHFDPDTIAEAYWRLHREPPPDWTIEVTYR